MLQSMKSCSRIRPRLFNKCDVTFRIMRAQCCKDTPRNSATLFYCKRCHCKSPDLRLALEQNSFPLSRIRHFLAPFAASPFGPVPELRCAALREKRRRGWVSASSESGRIVVWEGSLGATQQLLCAPNIEEGLTEPVG